MAWRVDVASQSLGDVSLLPEVPEPLAADRQHRKQSCDRGEPVSKVPNPGARARHVGGSSDGGWLKAPGDVENLRKPIVGCGMIGMSPVPSLEVRQVGLVMRAVQSCDPVRGLAPQPRAPVERPERYHRSRSSRRSIAAIALLICFSTPFTDSPVRSAISA